MAQFRVIVESVRVGTMTVEADDYDEAFRIAEQAGKDAFDWDDDEYIDWDMMTVSQV